MVKEYPNASQRRAVCESAWDKKHAMLVAYLKMRGYSPCQIAIEIERIEKEK